MPSARGGFLTYKDTGSIRWLQIVYVCFHLLCIVLYTLNWLTPIKKLGMYLMNDLLQWTSMGLWQYAYR